jgi:hypothetical protein
MPATITINRAPVLTLWAAVVAERLGHTHDAALTLGRALAGMNAQSKAVHLGLREPTPPGEKAKRRAAAGTPETVELMGRAIPVLRTPKGLRAAKDGAPESAEAVERYLASKFGDALEDARAAMSALAARYTPAALASDAYALYEKFRPEIPAGTRGWGAKGELDLAALAKLKPRTAAKRG